MSQILNIHGSSSTCSSTYLTYRIRRARYKQRDDDKCEFIAINKCVHRAAISSLIRYPRAKSFQIEINPAFIVCDYLSQAKYIRDINISA